MDHISTCRFFTIPKIDKRNSNETLSGAGSFFDPRSLAIDNEYIPPDENFYFTDKVTDYAIEFIDQNKKTDPFFMYVAYTAPHWPLHALPEDIIRYKGKYNTQRIKVDQGVEPTKGFFFLLIEVDLTRKQFDAIIT